MLNENASITNEREHVMHYCPKIMGITSLLSRTISIVVPSGHASCLLFVTNSFHYGVINFTLGPPNVMGFSAPTRLGMKISGLKVAINSFSHNVGADDLTLRAAVESSDLFFHSP